MFTSIQNQPEQIIQDRLSAVQRRIQINHLFCNLARCGFWGLVADGALLMGNRFIRLPIPVALTVLLPLAIAVSMGISLSLLRKTDLLAVACFVDRRLNLKERLSTAFEAIRRGEADDDFVRLQIRDAAHFAQEILPATAVPYTFPSTLKLFPLPLVLIVLSFAIPRVYEIPPLPTAAERTAIDRAAAELESEMQDIDDTTLTRQIRDTIKGLQNKNIDVGRSQERLSKLRDTVRSQKNQLQKEREQLTEAISKMNEESQRFSEEHAKAIAADMEKLAEQMEENQLSPEEQAELEALLKKLAERLAGNTTTENLTNQLAQLQTQAVSPEMLKQIARSLLAVDQKMKTVAQLEGLLDQIKASRRNIALAGIQMERRTGGVADASSSPGAEAGTGEVQGTQVQTEDPSTQSPEAETSTDLTLPNIPSDSEDFSQVYVEEDPTGKGEPTYMPYREVYLRARQAYAAAMERDEIPLRYRGQVKAYLEAIANPEK